MAMPHNHTEHEQCFRLSFGSHIDTPNDFRATKWAYPSSEEHNWRLDCIGQLDSSRNKRPPRSPRGVPWLPKAADLALKFHREPLWRRPTRLCASREILKSKSRKPSRPGKAEIVRVNLSMRLSSGPALRAFGSRGLGVSTFPWGRVTDTRERRSRHLSFYDPKVEGG
ncbi:hypothetical protein CRG98_021730 [Punica granatum]|uniref:Uncharacterized protein n=1 Tax=Punica granatum TaxID=22663 RepID=A0A2I0JNS4_PUNGR|nr:hypothetical protein CRG98_021730 [Punica granatum]